MDGKGGVRLTKSMRAFLRNYRDGWQNGVYHAVDTVWTRGNGGSFPGLEQSRRAGLVTSCEDPILHKGGWRHDLTPAGRAALNSEGEG